MNKELEALEILGDSIDTLFAELSTAHPIQEEFMSLKRIIKQALSTQVSEDVEELFKWFDGIVMSNKGSAIKSSKLNQLKTKFAQMEKRNKLLKRQNDVLIDDEKDWNNARNKIISLRNQNQRYKQLLDRLDDDTLKFVFSDECLGMSFETPTCSSCMYFVESDCNSKDKCYLKNVLNFFIELKQLKSLGSDENE